MDIYKQSMPVPTHVFNNVVMLQHRMADILTRDSRKNTAACTIILMLWN